MVEGSHVNVGDWELFELRNEFHNIIIVDDQTVLAELGSYGTCVSGEWAGA